MPLINQENGSSFVELSQIPSSSLTMDCHGKRGRGNEGGGGGVEIGLETGTSFGQGFARIRNANFVIFVLEYQKEQREKNQVRIVFINL